MTDMLLQLCNITIHSFQVHGHYSFLLRPWTLFIPFTFFFSFGSHVDTIHSFHFLFLSRGPLTESNYFPSYVGLHSTVVSTRLIPSGRACLGMPAHHACSTYVLSLHPKFNLWSQLLPITQFPCRSAQLVVLSI